MRVIRWETNTRYYAATMYRDLLGDIVIATANGGLRNNLGQMRIKPVSSIDNGRKELFAIAQKRARRHYRLIQTPSRAG